MRELPDAAARRQISEQLDRTLFVEAGAGSGKTRSLIDRVVATVLDPATAVALRQIAAVTFTEKAAAELRDRLRVAFEEQLTAVPADGARAERAALAIEDLDCAAIGTLHAFARRILGEHPIEAGLPPLIEVLDEVASGVAFDNWWTTLRTELLDDGEISPALLLAMAAGVRLGDLRSMARDFTDNWDLLEARVLSAPVDALPTVDASALATQAVRLAAVRAYCTDDGDKFLPHLDALTAWAGRLENAPDEPARLAVLGEASKLKWGYGRKTSWMGYNLDQLRNECHALVERVEELRNLVLDHALRTLARRIAQATLQAARMRRDEGRLEFHDLLVLARNLLRDPEHGAATRAALQQQYRRLLLDELQDTDPIQIELAVRILGGADATEPDWADIVVPDGSLFAVGDPKQSIYRFRRADINAYLTAQERIGGRVTLESNFRTDAPVLDWVNHVFSLLITPEEGSQPEYLPLRARRHASPAGPPVVVLGTAPHEDRPSADELRTREAADVVAAVRTAISQRWQVCGQQRLPDGDTEEARRPVELRDIAVLVPSRTSLPQLEAALDAVGIPYSAEASSLVYHTREVRDLLMAARAVDDPSDALTLVSALGSALFGCGDDDLWTWYRAGGSWNILAPPPDTIPAGHPVREAMDYLRHLHDEATWLTPSQLLGRLVDERRMLEVAADTPRARDAWRRLRFIVDQARAWTEAEHGATRGYLAWAARQGAETARVTEAVLPETDDDTLRLMTVHAAKGLEFPIVILSGMSSMPGGAHGGIDVLWPPDGCEFKLRAEVQTGDFDLAKPIDEQMDHHERLRLLYVACTRARDHLVVSLHRKTRASTPTPEDRNRTSAELLAGACVDAPNQTTLPEAPADVDTAQDRSTRQIDPPTPFGQWQEGIVAVREHAARSAAVSASQLEGSPEIAAPAAGPTHWPGEPIDPGLAKDARNLELPPWNKGRYGTAVGRAVHAVLQTVNLATGEGLNGAVQAQVLVEGVTQEAEVVAQLAHSALHSYTVQRAAARPHWRETYVGTVIGDRVLEGFVDLLYRDDDGLVIVDYKTDAVPMSALDQRVAFYRPQLAAYAAAIQAATGERAVRCILIFLSPHGTIERQVDDIADAVKQVKALTGQPGCEVEGMNGYGITVEFDGLELRIRSADFAAGASLGSDNVILPVADIASLSMKRPGLSSKGRIELHTRGGRSYKLHFTRKQRSAFEALHAKLQAAAGNGAAAPQHQEAERPPAGAGSVAKSQPVQLPPTPTPTPEPPPSPPEPPPPQAPPVPRQQTGTVLGLVAGTQCELRRSGYFRQQVAGESHHTHQLKKVAGREEEGEREVYAELRREPANHYDRNAVQVIIDGGVVGYLPREDAPSYQWELTALEEAGLTARCPARVWWRHEDRGLFASVSLDLAEPGTLVPISWPDPDNRHVIVPAGHWYQVVRANEHRDVIVPLLGDAPFPGRAFAYASLHLEERAGPRSTTPAVVARIEGGAVGELSKQVSRGLVPLLVPLQEAQIACYAETALTGNALAVKVRVSLTMPEELPQEFVRQIEAAIGR
jgi:ATP-dependent exoDNAse (exonuclease V) beta subunit